MLVDDLMLKTQRDLAGKTKAALRIMGIPPRSGTISQQTGYVNPMKPQRCFTVCNTGPMVKQHWFKVWCLLG